MCVCSAACRHQHPNDVIFPEASVSRSLAKSLPELNGAALRGWIIPVPVLAPLYPLGSPSGSEMLSREWVKSFKLAVLKVQGANYGQIKHP